MATLQDVLSVPAGWTVVHAVQPTDITTVPPGTQVEVETAELWALDVAGIEFGTPNIAQGLQQAAQEHGSNVYGVALLRKDTPESCGGFPTIGGLVQCTRYRFVIVHSQFQAIAILLGLVVAIGVVVLWICNEQPASQPCGDNVQSFAHDTLQQMCNIFGAGCALQALGTLLIAFSAVSIGLAGVLFFVESGIASKMGLVGPRLPAVPAVQGVQPPRVGVKVGPGVVPEVSVRSGGGGRRRGLGGGGGRF